MKADTPLSLKVDDWPTVDQDCWHTAQQPSDFLDPIKPASRWSSAGRDIVAESYGQWLSFLARHGNLQTGCAPGDRVTEQLLREFIAELSTRVAATSVAMTIGALLRALKAMEPAHNWTMLSSIHRSLKMSAKPTRPKRARIVSAADLFALGIRLMDTCEQAGTNNTYRATRYRDGLIVAVLISCPVRLKNLVMIEIGRHLLFRAGVYRLEFSADDTKTRRPHIAELPSSLTPYMDGYLRQYRAQLTARRHAPNDSRPERLWVDREGRPMSSGAIRTQIETRTKAAFGHVIWPHLFRDCAVTELVDLAPDEIGVANDLLGHRDFQTTQKHYVQAQGMTAHLRMQNMIMKRRGQVRQP